MSDIIDDDLNFPNRPQHEHFWRLSQIIISHDKRSEGKPLSPGEPPQVIKDIGIDEDSMSYMALQRAMRLHAHPDVPAIRDPELLEIAKLASTWVDGFCAGIIYGRTYDD